MVEFATYFIVMAGRFVINGGKPLYGTVGVAGAKNAVLKLIAACLLTKESCTLHNIPDISDVSQMLAILESMGVRVERPQKGTVSIAADRVDPKNIATSLVSKLRASVVLLGPLLVRFGEIRLPYPGGDRIGARPLDAHRSIFEQFGAEIISWDTLLHLRIPRNGLRPGRIVLPEFSVTATENAMLTASLLPGKTMLHIAAAEPHVQDLAALLVRMGINIQGAGTHDLIIFGEKTLSGATHTTIPDPLDAATFLIFGAATRGEIEICGAREDHLLLVLEKLKEMGVGLKVDGSSISVSGKGQLRATRRIQAMPYPGIPSDLQALFAVLATQAEGETQIHDPLFEGRFLYVNELKRMGAAAEQHNSHEALIRGVTKLSGMRISSFDIRAGAAMVLAGLIAGGQTIIEGVEHIDRGYEDLDGRLRSLGADIIRQ